MDKYLLLCLCFCLTVWASRADVNYRASIIDDGLRMNALSVVRNNETVLEIKSDKKAIYKESRAVTILEPEGKDAADFTFLSSSTRKLAKFTATIYDRMGEPVLKENKKKLLIEPCMPDKKNSSLVLYRYVPKPSSYPYTVVYEWEVVYAGAPQKMPLFMPQKQKAQAVERADYTIIAPPTYDFKHVAFNIFEDYTQSTTDKVKMHIFKMRNLPAIPDSPYSLSLSELAPHIMMLPIGNEEESGDLNDWAAYAQWYYKKLKDMASLSDEQRNKISVLANTAHSEQEKFRVLRDSMAVTQPYNLFEWYSGDLPLAPVSDLPYFRQLDSRMLAMYWWAVLREAGMDVEYVLTSRQGENLAETPNRHQLDYALLRIKCGEDSIWLDGGDTIVEKGYMRSMLRGHDMLVIGENTNEILRLPLFPDTANRQTSYNRIVVKSSGMTKMDLQLRSYGMCYETMRPLLVKPLRMRKQAFSDMLAHPMNIGQMSLVEKVGENPDILLHTQMSNGYFTDYVGSTLFMSPNVLRNGFPDVLPVYRRMGDDVFVKEGFTYVDTMEIIIPENYEIDLFPNDRIIESEYGTFSMHTELLPNGAIIIHKLLLRGGRYSASAYDDFMRFCVRVSDAYAEKLYMRPQRKR